jgi:hypothetical protein
MKKFIAIVILSPWVAYRLLCLVATNEAAWSFVSASLWVGTPILVLVAALRAYDEGLKRGSRFTTADDTTRPSFQATQLGQLN